MAPGFLSPKKKHLGPLLKTPPRQGEDHTTPPLQSNLLTLLVPTRTSLLLRQATMHESFDLLVSSTILLLALLSVPAKSILLPKTILTLLLLHYAVAGSGRCHGHEESSAVRYTSPIIVGGRTAKGPRNCPIASAQASSSRHVISHYLYIPSFWRI